MPLAVLLAVLAAFAPHVQDPAPLPDAPCRIFGTFVDEAGAPVDGVTLEVKGWQASTERIRRFGLPRGWQNPTPVTTGDDGKLSLSFVPPRAFQFTLEANAPGLARVAWRWNEIEPGKELDLGVVTLVRDAVLVGHILDTEGNLLVEGWVVSAWHNSVVGHDDWTSTTARSFIDLATGQFRLEGLPSGEWLVDASKGSARIEGVRVKTKQGEETFLELRHRGADPRRQLVVWIDTRPFPTFSFEPGSMHAIAPDGTRYAMAPVPDRVSEWHVADIAPGSYRVEVRDPRFVDWTKEALSTGLVHRAHLAGSAMLRIAVVDGVTGAAIEGYDLDIGYRNADLGRRDVRVRERAVPSPVGGLYSGIVPGDVTVAVEAEGWPPVRVEVGALALGETRDVTVTLTAGTALRGRVVDSAGRPVAGADVSVTSGEYPGHDRVGGGVAYSSGVVQGERVSFRIGYRDDATTTADDGSFTFAGLGAGTYALLARRGPWNEVWTTVELPRAESMELTLPDAALTSIRVRLPAGESPVGLRLTCSPRRNESSDVSRALRSTLLDHPWTCDAEGVFAARHLPPGAHRLEFWRAVRDDEGMQQDRLLEHKLTLEGTAATLQELDLRETSPVRVTLRTPIPTLEPSEFWMLQVALLGERRPRQTSSRTSPGSDGKQTHTQWRVPGTYRVVVSAPGLLWSLPEPVHVVRGAPNVFEVPVPLVEREVRVLGVDGSPLADTVVAYWTDSKQRAVGTTDHAGLLAVVLLEGALSLALPPRQDPGIGSLFLAGLTSRATADFEPGHGPLELRLSPE